MEGGAGRGKNGQRQQRRERRLTIDIRQIQGIYAPKTAWQKGMADRHPLLCVCSVFIGLVLRDGVQIRLYIFGFLGPLGLDSGRFTTPFLKCVSSNFSKKTNNPNPSPIGNKFGLFLFGPSGENRTHGLLNPIVLLSKTQCTIRYCLDSVSLNFKCIIPFCFIGCQDVSFLLWSNCGQPTPTNDFSPPAKLHRAISIFINRSCAFCLHELSIRRICQPCQ